LLQPVLLLVMATEVTTSISDVIRGIRHLMTSPHQYHVIIYAWRSYMAVVKSPAVCNCCLDRQCRSAFN